MFKTITITIILHCICTLSVSSQSRYLHGILPLDETGNVLIERVDSLPGVLATEIYTRAKVALFSLFRSGKDVLQLDDKDNSMITGRGSLTNIWESMGFQTKMNVHFTITIRARDGRYKSTISNIEIECRQCSPNYTKPIEVWQMSKGKIYREKNALRYLSQVMQDLLDFSNSLYKSMSGSSQGAKDNW